MVHTRPLRYIHKDKMTSMMKTPFRFVDLAEATGGVYWARLAKGIRNFDELMIALYHVLSFPGYFGFNWNALSECLCDFHWVTEKKIVLIHARLPDIPDEQLQTYLKILSEAVLYWRPEGEHEFEVIFSETDQVEIEKLLSE